MSDRVALVFPGQGSQAVGMGREFFDRCGAARALFEQADEILGYKLSELCFNGPEDRLKQTIHTQPALYVAAAAAFVAGRDAGLRADFAAGHSLGEYTALFAAGVFDFETGLRLVRARAEAMQQCAERHPGAMAAVMGLEGERTAAVCAQAAAETGAPVQPANFNAPDQVVISGAAAAVERACSLAKDAGARRALPLPVSGAFHSPLMNDAAEAMRRALQDAVLAPPAIRFINNVDADFLSDPADIKESLARQITGSVKWCDAVQRLSEAGAGVFIEVGPGRVLQGLIRRIVPAAKVLGAGTPAELDATLNELRSMR
ncbi:MAG: ACP S-malonyltransferase [Candidatus Sumerlaeia bacterium]